MRMLYAIVVSMALWLFPPTAWGRSDLWPDSSASVGVCVLDVHTGAVVASCDDTRYFTPASTQKLVTTATSLLCRGADYRFTTTVSYRGEIAQRGRLQGDIIVRGGGDPSLASQYGGMPADSFLRATVESIRAAGIRAISGRIIVDDGVVYPEPVVSKWLWEDVGNYYAAGCYGVNYADNRFVATYTTGAPDTRPQLRSVIPHIPGLRVYDYLTTNRSGIDSAYIYGAPYDYTRRVYGSLPAHKEQFSIKGDMPDPPHYIAALLTDTLRRIGVKVAGAPTTVRLLREAGEAVPEGGERLLYAHHSSPLVSLIAHTLAHSDNLYAEALLRDVALTVDTVATLAGGVGQMLTVWREAGFPLDGATLYDGSGLSPLNRITPLMMARLLAHIARTPGLGETFIHTLPHPGEGTLRRFMPHSPLVPALWLKSGSMTAVQCYAGYYTPADRLYAVVVMVNHITTSRTEVRDAIAQLLNRLLPR